MPYKNGCEYKIKCPWCDYNGSKYRNHLKRIHPEKTLDDYYLITSGAKELPKCKNTECNNKVHVEPTKFRYGIGKFCSAKCAHRYEFLNNNPSFNRKQESNEKMVLTELKSHQTSRASWNAAKKLDPNKYCEIYLGLSKDINRIKIGFGNSANGRKYRYELGGIKFDEFIVIKSKIGIAPRIEETLMLEFNDYTLPLEKDKFPKWRRLGYTEYFDHIIWDKFKSRFYELIDLYR
jgi:hypothetical protein